MNLEEYKTCDNEFILKKENLNALRIGSYSLVVTYSDKSTETCTIQIKFFDEKSTIMDVPVLYMKKSMSIGNTFTLTFTGVKDNASIVYTTSDKNIVMVSSMGTLKAKANGTAIVTAIITQNGSQYKVQIKVKVVKGLPYNRTMNERKAIFINTSLPVLNLYKRVSIGNKTRIEAKNCADDAVITYSSDNKMVATVSKSGVITAKGEGECVVTIKIKQNGRTYCYKIHVMVPKVK